MRRRFSSRTSRPIIHFFGNSAYLRQWGVQTPVLRTILWTDQVRGVLSPAPPTLSQHSRGPLPPGTVSHAALRKVSVRYVRLARCPGASMPHALSRPRRASPRQATLSFAGRVGDVCKEERQQAGGRPALEQLQPPAAPSRVPRSACRSFGRSVCPPPCVAGREERSSDLVRPSVPLVVEV
jgi:hypothetical protein